jgi:ribosomal protein S18 acetylase RimI-like enzyme
MERRPATSEDFELVHRIARAGLGPYVQEIWGWDERDQRRRQRAWLDRGGVEIVEVDGAAVGCLKVTVEAGHVFVDRLALLPEAQGKGLGTRLMLEVISDAEARGLPVRLSVLVNNPARRLYERLGFEVVEIVKPRVLMERRPSSPGEP